METVNLIRISLEYIEREGITKEEYAKRVGVSRSALSMYLNGKYTSDPKAIEKSIIDYLKSVGEITEEVLEEEAKREIQKFILTKDAANILGLCKSCNEYNALGMIVGKSGYGKTHTLRQYASMPKTIYIECDDSMGVRDLVKALERKIGLPTSYGSVCDRANNIKDFFNTNEGYTVIIDEADKLINKETQKKLELLRAIFDQSNVALVIAGEPMLQVLIRKYLPRFANRIDFYYELKGLTKEDVSNYLKPFKFTEDAVNEMSTRATNTQNGCFRLLDRTLKNILRICSPNDDITVDAIKQASGMMMI